MNVTIHWNAWEAALWLSLFAAPLGCFMIFRKLSFFGDALSHSSMAGIALAYLIGAASPVWLSLGALGSVLATSVLLQILERRGRLPTDVALTVSYSGMFAIGLLLLSSSQVELEHILFGNIWSISPKMLWFLRVWGVTVLAIVVMGWRSLWASVVDSKLAHTLGFPVERVEFLLIILISISVVGIIQGVGVILVAAYLVLPAASALPWSRSLRSLAALSVLFAFVASLTGLLASVQFALSAGPCIAVSAFILFLISHTARLIPN